MAHSPRPYLLRVAVSALALALAGTAARARTIEFTTTEVTEADVTISPDGQWLVFTMLGHLFWLPVTGGTAEQLTFGPYYDTDPVFSPDGSRVAFVSDRDGSEGNVFVLELATGQITQVTREPRAARRPTWTPDGRAIVYLRFERDHWLVPALVRRVALDGRDPETLRAPLRLFRSVFYLPDGRLAWTAVEQEDSPRVITRFEVMSPQGAVSTLRTVAGHVDRVVSDPLGNGLYCRRYLPLDGGEQPEHLLFLALPEGTERTILPVWGDYSRPRFAVAADSKRLYVGDAGRLWEIALPSGARHPISFSARVKLEVQDPVQPPKPALTVIASSRRLPTILDPRLSPDGRTLVFGAAGYLWHQSLNGGPAQRLFEGSAFEREPAFSPDGRQLAFVHSELGKIEVRVFDFDSRQTRTPASGLNYWGLSWSPDGQRLVFVEFGGGTDAVVAVDLGDGKKEKLTEPGWWWGSRPHFSADAESLYFTGEGGEGTVYRLRPQEKTKPEAVTQLEGQLARALVSRDGHWLAFRRNSEIWVAPLGAKPVGEEDIRLLSPEGGDSFAFTPDGSALIYAAGNRVWRHPLGGGEREEILIRLELPRPAPPPLLLRRVRVLDFPPQAGPPRADKAGGFGPETSLFIEQGRIRWTGSEHGRKIPRETVILDAGGRFAIPGLFDLHVHQDPRWSNQEVLPEAFIAYGVTSVRDAGAWLAWMNTLADRGKTGSLPMPRYFFSGEMLRGAVPPRFWLFPLIHNADEARKYVRRLKEGSAHFIKVHPPISWPLQRTVTDEARQQGLPVIGHGTTVKEITKSVTLGYRVLEHGPWGRFYDDVIKMLAATGTRWDPTLGVWGGNALLLRDEPERLADAKLRAFASEADIAEAQTGDRNWKTGGAKALRGHWAEVLAGIRAAHHLGVKLQMGTDTEPDPPSFFGSSLHWALEFFVEAGIPPLEVLRIATQQAAEALGAQDDLGTLEPGKLADIVLLDKSPLEDIRNTQTIWRVIKDGWLFDPGQLRPPTSASSLEGKQ